MTLVTRFKRLLRADLHELLDAVEEPGPVLRQALREMDETLDRERHRVERLRKTAVQLETQQSELHEQMTRCDKEIDTCFAAGNHELSRTVIRRKLETQRRQQWLGNAMQANAQKLQEATAQLQDRTAELARLRQQADLFAEHEDTEAAALCAGPGCSANASHISADDVEVAFLQELQRRQPS